MNNSNKNATKQRSQKFKNTPPFPLLSRIYCLLILEGLPRDINEQRKCLPSNLSDKEDHLRSLDNWTETTIDTDLLKTMEDIDFVIQSESSTSKQRSYKCRHCKHTETAFAFAQRHYIEKHLNCYDDIEKVKECITARQSAMEEVKQVSLLIRKNEFDRNLVNNKLEMIVTNLQSYRNRLQKMNASILPPNIEFKRSSIEETLQNDICKIRTMINSLNQ